MILQVFGQRFFFCERMGQWMFWKTLKNFEYKLHIYRPLVTFQKTCEELWLFRVIFKISSLVIDYRCVVIDYTINFEELWLFSLNFKIFMSGNRLHNSGNRLHLLKSKFKLFMKAVKTICASGNRLQPRVIDYQREKYIFSKWNTCLNTL